MGKYVTNWDKYPNFRKEEFKCKCGKCNGYGNGIAISLVETMQDLRTKYGKAINISSGYRCKEHNAEVGGSKTSKHMQGLACDFYFKDGSLGNQSTREKIVNELKQTKYYHYSYCNIDGSHPNMGSAIHLDTLLVDIEEAENLDIPPSSAINNEQEKIDEVEEPVIDHIENVVDNIIKDENAKKFNVICTCILAIINFIGKKIKKFMQIFIKG